MKPYVELYFDRTGNETARRAHLTTLRGAIRRGDMPDLVLGFEQAGDVVGLSTSTVMQWHADGHLVAAEDGRALLSVLVECALAQRTGPEPKYPDEKIREFREAAYDAWQAGALVGHGPGRRKSHPAGTLTLRIIAGTLGMTLSTNYAWMLAHGKRRQAAGGPVIPVGERADDT